MFDFIINMMRYGYHFRLLFLRYKFIFFYF